MSKEDKATEMARRREERKQVSCVCGLTVVILALTIAIAIATQRIAQLKEQKKGTT
jgi:hypothetical protein